MSGEVAGTSGGTDEPSGGTRRRRILWLVLIFVAFAGLHSFANVESTRADLASLGRHERAAHLWTWELSSVGMWVLLLPAIGWLVARVRPPRFAWPWALLLHLLATVPLSALHVAGMVAIRIGIYAAAGERYGFGSLGGRFLYEYRKDLVSYVMLAAFMALALWWLSRREAAPAPAEGAGLLRVTDGSVTHHVPVDAIDWAGSAGNYVEIAWGKRRLLHRSTLAALAAQLGGGFARIHRGRIVRRAAIRSIETDRSGDFTVTLADGTQLRGSRRFRAALDK